MKSKKGIILVISQPFKYSLCLRHQISFWSAKYLSERKIIRNSLISNYSPYNACVIIDTQGSFILNVSIRNRTFLTIYYIIVKGPQLWNKLPIDF